VEIIKTGVSTHLANGRTTKHFTTRELIGTLTFIRLVSGIIIAKHLGLDRCCIYQSLQRCNFIDDGAIDLWPGTKRHEWCTTLSIELKTLVVEWWTMKTTISFDWKIFCNKRIGVEQLIEHPTHLLQVSQVSDKKILS
jgi:hypothetical protein